MYFFLFGPYYIVGDSMNQIQYQWSEFDCCPMCYINVLCHFLKKDEIKQDTIKAIFQDTLDRKNGGTSKVANLLLTTKLMEYKEEWNIPFRTTIYYGSKVNETLFQAIFIQGLAMIRTYLEVPHYCLVTGMDQEFIYLLDPYELPENVFDDHPNIWIIHKPFANRKVKRNYFFEDGTKDYMLGPISQRECIVFYKDRKK